MRIMADWITNPTTQAVMNALVDADGNACARFVGGCVRNAIMGRAVTDIDIATQMPPQQVIAALNRANIKVVPTGLNHGTVTGVIDGQPFEITTLRQDVETDGRHATVSFTDDWAVDAARRDFTMNALYADITGQVYDPTTRGLPDIQDKRVRFIGEPMARINEDGLRILRFFRFQAWYGGDDIDAQSLAACVALKENIKSLSAERVGQEMLKLLSAPNPSDVINIMQESGIWHVVMGGNANTSRVANVVQDDQRHNLPIDPIIRLAACLGQGTDISQISNALRLSRQQQKRILCLLSPLSDDLQAAVVKSDKVSVLAQYRLTAPIDINVYNDIQNWQVPNFPVSGQDLLGMGVAAGPELGMHLEELRQIWIDQGYPDRQSMLALARQRAS